MKSMWSESVTASFILELWHFNQCITGKHSSPLFCGCNRALAVYHCGATVWLLPASHNDTSCSIQRWHFRNWAYKRNYLMWPQYIIAPPRQLAPCTSPTSFISPMTTEFGYQPEHTLLFACHGISTIQNLFDWLPKSNSPMLSIDPWDHWVAIRIVGGIHYGDEPLDSNASL